MALKDLLSKAKEVASDLAITAKSLIPKTEEEKKAEAAAKAAEAARKKQEEFETRTALPPLPTFDCPYGGCFADGQRLMCSCPDTQKCPEGKKLEYYKRTFYYDADRLAHAARFQEISKLAGLLTYEEYKLVNKKAVMDFAQIYYPNLADPALVDVLNLIDYEASCGSPNETHEKVLKYFNDRGNVTERESACIWNLCMTIGSEEGGRYRKVAKELIEEHFEVLIRDPDFFKWENSKEFLHAIKGMCVAINPEGCGDDIRYREGRLEELFDSEGHVKPAGLGGALVGETGDTIWNTYEKWAAEPEKPEQQSSMNAFLLGENNEEE